jgi:phosphatidylserine/phosphatidylglycerophosphate/cardiolipin synthase-like enzyme
MRRLILFALVLSLFPIAKISGADWNAVYFTEPDKNRHGGTFSPPQDGFLRLLSAAKTSIDGAFFEIESEKVADGFIAAKNRGVNVRLVTDERSLRKKAYKRIVAAGISVVNDDKKGFMHNKFCIVDGKYVWTGSYNITDSCAYQNNNNAILLLSPELANIYDDEFAEMFERHVFKNKRESRPFSFSGNPYYVKIGQSNINAYFSPDNDVEDIIVKRIRKARKSICFLAFSFTSDPIGEAMIERHSSGVEVKGVFEKRGSNSKESEYKKFLVEGIPVKTDRNPRNMHHKVIIIDEEIVITGSYNFSKNASAHNDENLLIIEDAEIAKKYLAEFRRLY